MLPMTWDLESSFAHSFRVYDESNFVIWLPSKKEGVRIHRYNGEQYYLLHEASLVVEIQQEKELFEWIQH